MKFSIYYFDRLKSVIIIFVFLLLLFVLFNLFFPTVAFAVGPCAEEITDQYGNTEYTGKDPYGYFHNPVNKGESIVATSIDTSPILDSYGTNPPHERD